MSMQAPPGYQPPGQGTAGTTDLVTQLQNIVRQLSALVAAKNITLPITLANGGLAGSQAAATADQVPVFPGSGGPAVPTTITLSIVAGLGTGIAAALAINVGSNGSPAISGGHGTFVANGVTPVTVSNTNIAITDSIIISLKTVGGTVGVQPHVATITAATGFTVVCTAGDTSTYNYSVIKNP